MTRGAICKHNIWQALISLDQAVHACGGAIWAVLACLLPVLPTGQAWADETLSCRAWRWHRDGVRHWPCRLIDVLFFWDHSTATGRKHCELAFHSEQQRRQCPPELRMSRW